MSNTTEWTCEHGAVRGEGCREYGCCGCDPDDPCACFPELSTPTSRYIVRPSAVAVNQARTLGAKRYPLQLAARDVRAAALDAYKQKSREARE